ncbi:MAG: nucleotide sugar dehydrogenase [Candidatus Moranbacteria bacterium]|nr:nucleotide sugar dehydrogenase [Candidatus Moranbacteria bacterium]
MNHEKTVCVIGLGYVGLPMAIRSKEVGYEVYGLDLDQSKLDLINQGKSPIEEAYIEERIAQFPVIATNDAAVIRKADIVLICVPTPVDESYYPDLTPVIKAVETTVKNLKKGALVVLESTVNPGVSEEIIRPLFESAGHIVGQDVFIAHCPERVNPGDKTWNVSNLPRVVGSFDQTGLDIALEYYRSISSGEIRPMKSIREAEAVKIVENSFRDINIAFVNELAKSFDKLGIDIKDVILGAATKPFAFMAHYPSCGVGGHCIAVDPYYLIERAKKSGFDHKFLKIAREINNSMPEYTVEKLQDALNLVKLPMNGTAIGVLGLAYKANVDDTRESPAFEVIKNLNKHLAIVETFDPHVLGKSTSQSLEAILEKSKAVIVTTNHKEFIDMLTPELLNKYGILVVIDGKNCLDKDLLESAGIIYRGIGR